MNIDGEDIILNASDWMRVDPSTKHQLRAADNSAISYICIQTKADSLEGFTNNDGVLA